MRCVQCGRELEDGITTCTRCGADLSPQTRVHALVITVVYTAISIVLIAAIVYVVLYWHEAQVLALV